RNSRRRDRQRNQTCHSWDGRVPATRDPGGRCHLSKSGWVGASVRRVWIALLSSYGVTSSSTEFSSSPVGRQLAATAEADRRRPTIATPTSDSLRRLACHR